MKKYLIMILVLISVILTACSNEGNNIPDNSGGNLDNNALAQCLTEKGVTMFGTEWCSHCQNQKRAFGDSFQYIDYVDCDQNRDACTTAGVRGYPTWKIDGENYPGEQPLERLAALAGC